MNITNGTSSTGSTNNVDQSTDYHSLSWPLPFSFLLVGSLLYSIYNFLLFLLGIPTKDIWFIPGPLARILQGVILFLLFSFLYFIHSSRLRHNSSFFYPSNFVLFGFLLSLTVHYLGMLPPWKIYDTFRFLDKLIHFLNCFWLAWIFVWFFALRSPSPINSPLNNSFSFKVPSPLFPLFLKALFLSFFLAFLWEVLEFVSLPQGVDWWNASSMSYGFKDTVYDLIFDFLGSLFGSFLALKKLF